MKNHLGPLATAFCLVVFYFAAGCSGGSPSSPTTTTTTTTPQVTAPTVSTIAPAAVPAGTSATNLTVTGTGFTASTTVQVNGVVETTTYVSATQVTAVIPAGQLATGALLQVVAANGTAASPSVNLEVDNPAPTVAQFSPAFVTAGSGPVAVAVTGTGFLPSTTIQVGTASRATTYVSATQLSVALTAADFASATPLALTAVNPTPGGGASSVASLPVNNATPAITQLAPTSIAAGSAAATITVTGSSFVSATVLRVNGTARPTTYVSATQLTASLPASDFATGASLAVTAFTPTPGGGSSATLTLSVTNPVPAITQLTPATLIAGSSSSTVSVVGTGFVPSTVINVAGTSRVTTYISPTQVNATLTTADLALAGSVSLTAVNPTPGGGTSPAASVAVNVGTPTITAFTPASLITATATNTTVTVTGTNFVPTSYIIVGSLARSTSFISSTQLSFVATVADQAAPTTLRINVVNPSTGGNSNTASLPVAGPTPTPVITSIQPTSFFVGSSSTPITVYGSGITTSSTVQWNGTTLPGINGFYYQGSTIVAVTSLVPATLLTGTGTVTITVTTPTSAPSVSNTLNVSIANPPAPTLTSISPGYGALNTPATVTLIGTGFTASSTATFNGTSIPVTFNSSTSLTANVPASAVTLPGNLPIAVTTPAPGGGTSASLPFSAYVGIVNNSMIYNPTTGLAYVSVPSSAGAPYGNSIVSVDPATGALGTPIYVGSEPDKLALTSDGRYLWVGLDGASAVRKVDLTTNTAGLQFSLNAGTSGSFTAATAVALAALPGATDSVIVAPAAVSYGNYPVTIYDSGVQRTNVTSSSSSYFAGGYALAVNGTLGEIYLASNTALNIFTYSSNGLTLKTSAQAGTYATTPGDDIQIANGILYTNYGKAYNSETGALVGTFYLTGVTTASGATGIDASLGKVFIIPTTISSSNSYNQLLVFNTADYTANSVIPFNVPNYVNSTYVYPSHLTRWGSNGLVFREPIGVFSVRSNLVKDLSTTLADLNVTLASSGSTTTGGNTIYTATVSNAGPSASTNVALTVMPPSTGIVISATPSVGTCSVATTISCDLGSLALNGSATVAFTVTQTTSGNAVFTAHVAATETDPSLADNQASLTLAITGSPYSLPPVVNSVSPSAVVAGTTDTLINVTGSNFTSSSTIQVGGTAVSTNVISGTQLTATIPAAQLTTLGWLPISVSTAAPGGGLSASVPLSIYSIITVPANHMLFDPYSRKIMASIASTATSLTGNSLVAITPESSSIGTPISIGSQPSNLGLTDDGQILYVSLLGSNSVARFNMLTHQPDFTVPITSPTSYYNYIPADIATFPGAENTIALSVGSYGIGLYDFDTTAKTATPRTNLANYTYGVVCPRFTDASRLITPSSSSSGLSAYPVTSSGFGAVSTSTLSSFTGCIQVGNGKVFSSIGGVANLSTSPISQSGTFALGGSTYNAPPTAADTSLQRSFFLSNLSPANPYGNLTGVSVFDQNTLLPVSSVQLNIASTETTSYYTFLDFIRWGQDGLAALSSSGHIYLLRGAAVVPQLLNTNTAATLTSSSATTITHGSGNTLLTLTGSNFIPGVAVTWNGSYRTTTIADATHLTVAIPASDLTTAGTASLVATNPGAPASAALSVTIN